MTVPVVLRKYGIEFPEEISPDRWVGVLVDRYAGSGMGTRNDTYAVRDARV